MRTFHDSSGKQWELSLTIGAVKRVRSLSDGRYDLTDPQQSVDGKPLFEALTGDMVECWQVLWYLIEPQAIATGITAEQFGERMEPDALLKAKDELLKEWLDFFQKSQRPDLVAALGMVQRGHQTLTRVLMERMQATSPELDRIAREMEERIAVECGPPSGNFPDLSASTPAA